MGIIGMSFLESITNSITDTGSGILDTLNDSIFSFIGSGFVPSNISYDMPTKDVKAVTYVNTLADWWPPKDILKDLGDPEFTEENAYNVYIMTFWLPNGDPSDTAALWAYPISTWVQILNMVVPMKKLKRI